MKSGDGRSLAQRVEAAGLDWIVPDWNAPAGVVPIEQI